MKLDDEEQAMRAGALGRVAQIAIEPKLAIAAPKCFIASAPGAPWRPSTTGTAQ